MNRDSDIAKRLLEVIPKCMRIIRRELRQFAKPSLTVPQFRVLANIFQGTQLTSELAELHGISLPAMSTLVDGLVRRGFVTRRPGTNDRRHVVLKLSRKGSSAYAQVRKNLEVKLAVLIASFNDEQKSTLLEGLSLLETIFH